MRRDIQYQWRGYVVQVIHVDRKRGRVKFAHWGGPLRGDVEWMSLSSFKRLYRETQQRAR